jgi:hypothetical protein
MRGIQLDEQLGDVTSSLMSLHVQLSFRHLFHSKGSEGTAPDLNQAMLLSEEKCESVLKSVLKMMPVRRGMGWLRRTKSMLAWKTLETERQNGQRCARSI